MNAELFKSVIINPEVFYQKPGKVLIGPDVASRLTANEQQFVAEQINTKLVENEANMEALSTEKILEIMNGGKAVIRLGDNNELLGFAQVSEDIYDPRIVVIGSWLSNQDIRYTKGSGTIVMQEAARLAFNRNIFPNTRRVITRVKSDNYGPQAVLEKMQAEHDGWQDSPKTGRRTKVYDLTLIGLGRIH